MRMLVLCFALVLAVASNHISYEGFKLYRLMPSNENHLDFLVTLENNENFDFWSKGHGINVEVDIMVNPYVQAQFEEVLKIHSMKYEIIIQNIERVVENERIAQNRAPRVSRGGITFTKYHRYSEMQDYLIKLQETHPKIVRLHSAGKSVLGSDLTAIQISTDPDAKKPIIFIDGGQHAREWIASATALYVINELIHNSENQYLLERFDWHIMPLLNPDGYEHSQTVQRFWRKTRSTNSGSTCLGTDLNRNFGDHWGGSGSSSYPCSEVYKGSAPFSEPEAKALEKYILSIKERVKLYLSLHNFGQYILHPWGYGYELPEDATELKYLGDLAADAIKSLYNTRYNVGSVTQFLRPGAGGSDDWVKSGAGVKYSYTIELPGGGSLGFDLPPSEILKTVEETFEGIKAFHNYLSEIN